MENEKRVYAYLRKVLGTVSAELLEMFALQLEKPSAGEGAAHKVAELLDEARGHIKQVDKILCDIILDRVDGVNA